MGGPPPSHHQQQHDNDSVKTGAEDPRPNDRKLLDFGMLVVGRRIGRGGFASVYAADYAGRQVALKLGAAPDPELGHVHRSP